MKRIFTALTVAAMSLVATAQNATLTIHADQGNQKIHKKFMASLLSTLALVFMAVYGLAKIPTFQTSKAIVRMSLKL